MGSTYVTVELVRVNTCCCRVEMGIARDLYNDCKRYGRRFHCVKCGKSLYFKESETNYLKKQVEALKKDVDREKGRRHVAEQQRNAARKSHQKMRARVRNGVCPCCNRSFENLLRHMRTQHPGYGDDNTLRQLRIAYGMTQSDLADELGVTQAHVSNFECGRSVATWARDQLESWISSQAKA